MAYPERSYEGESKLRAAMKLGHNAFKWAAEQVSLPVLLGEYFKPETGSDYRVGLARKLRLALRMARNESKIIGASRHLEHLLMATQILNVPRSSSGCAVECGSYKGRSAANLSLACALCERRLEIFDSFEGLPKPSEEDLTHSLPYLRELHRYSKGAYAGSLDEVKQNIRRYGDADHCNFNVGFFEQTLPDFHNDCIFVFADVDLRDSLKICIRFLWPLLRDGCYFFVHEASHREIASLFFDDPWWRSCIGCAAPGLVGAGTGLGLFPASGGFLSNLGYTIKNVSHSQFRIAPQTGSSEERAASLL